jgi:hypothetical protein
MPLATEKSLAVLTAQNMDDQHTHIPDLIRDKSDASTSSSQPEAPSLSTVSAESSPSNVKKEVPGYKRAKPERLDSDNFDLPYDDCSATFELILFSGMSAYSEKFKRTLQQTASTDSKASDVSAYSPHTNPLIKTVPRTASNDTAVSSASAYRSNYSSMNNDGLSLEAELGRSVSRAGSGSYGYYPR